MNQNPPDNTTAPRSVDQQQACSACALLHELQSRMKAMETAHHRLVWEVAKASKWEPQGCDDLPAGIAESWCTNCRTCHYPLSGCPGDLGSVGPMYDGPEGPVGMPGLHGANADGTPGETEEEHMQRYRDAIAHNERFFAKYPQAANSEPNGKDQATRQEHAANTQNVE